MSQLQYSNLWKHYPAADALVTNFYRAAADLPGRQERKSKIPVKCIGKYKTPVAGNGNQTDRFIATYKLTDFLPEIFQGDYLVVEQSLVIVANMDPSHLAFIDLPKLIADDAVIAARF